ncbi:TolC family protein [Pedosphaera parvula]|uniref:Outer membrane efflux protein n=1 Tax=Pedosphaera parvula (strain Ellin514) TaxID=320771 RepID=B9XCA7_PEDPL|nr:TolC family protein [Pedosphaera parvula]EEF62575.1 outer membrane efflux protein [Pedosphaera parvula Ellin514]
MKLFRSKKHFKFILAAALCTATSLPAWSTESTVTNQAPAWLSGPLSLAETMNLALKQNGNILRGQSNLEAAYGLVVQTRAVALPVIRSTGNFTFNAATENFPVFGAPIFVTFPDKSWAANIQIIQSVYEGGRITSALRSAKLTKEQALLQYQTVVADALLQVRVAYYDILQAEEQIVVEEASVKLLTQELQDQTKRYEAGTVPRFNVLRAEVSVANERPRLIQARNAYRISKNNLVNLLGYRVPPTVSEDIPLTLTDKLDAEPYEINLPVAVAKALQNRSELAALQKTESLRNEDVISAKAGYKPSVQAFAGYSGRNTQFSDDLGRVVNGAQAGIQFTWNIWDGWLTKGRVQQAQAQHQGAMVDVDNETRNIELEVRTQYSNFIQARETLESQKKVQEEAEEALRLATARSEAGTGTQLDVLQAETSLTTARSTLVQALHDYDVARARVERAMGINIMQSNK